MSTTPTVNLQPESWEIFDLGQALTLDFPEPRWLVESLVPEGTVILVSGQPHVGKTLDWLAAGIEAVTRHTGEPMWGQPNSFQKVRDQLVCFHGRFLLRDMTAVLDHFQRCIE